MTIQISEYAEPDKFKSKHWVRSRSPEGVEGRELEVIKEIITISGIVEKHIKGTGSGWYRDTLEIQFFMPSGFIPRGQTFCIEEWMPFITLNAIGNDKHAVNAGWAVDEFWGPGAVKTVQLINLKAKIAVRDNDGWLLRIGYTVTLKGHFEPL